MELVNVFSAPRFIKTVKSAKVLSVYNALIITFLTKLEIAQNVSMNTYRFPRQERKSVKIVWNFSIIVKNVRIIIAPNVKLVTFSMNPLITHVMNVMNMVVSQIMMILSSKNALLVLILWIIALLVMKKYAYIVFPTIITHRHQVVLNVFCQMMKSKMIRLVLIVPAHLKIANYAK